MRMALNIVGMLSLLSGCLWFLQGINVLPDNFMTGQTQWAVYGVISVVAGTGFLIAAKRQRT